MINRSMLICNFRCMLLYALTFIRAPLSPKARLAARLLAAESQLAVLKHRIEQKKESRPWFTHESPRYSMHLLY